MVNETIVGTPHINTKRVKMPDEFEGELEHGMPYEIVIQNMVCRVKEKGVGGGPELDPVTELSGYFYKYILDQGGQYPHYFYARWRDPIQLTADGGEYEYYIEEFRIQFIANSPFFITVTVAGLIAIGLLIGIIIISAGFVWFILRPAGEWAEGAGAIIVVVIVAVVALVLIFGLGGLRR